MKILFVIDSLGGSGAEISTAALLPYLRNLGHDVAVSTLYESGVGDEDRIRAQGFIVSPLSGSTLLAKVRELRRRIRSFRPDVVHTALFHSNVVGRLAAAGSGAVLVSSLVNTPYDAARGDYDPRMTRWKVAAVRGIDSLTARALVDKFHAVSAGVADAAVQTMRVPRDRVVVVERGRSRGQLGRASTSRRARVRGELGVAPSAKVVIAIGRQVHQKAHVDFVRAIDVLCTRTRDVVALLVGRPGPATKMIECTLAASASARGAVRILGHRHDVADLLVAADVLAITSRWEGTAGVALEAMGLHCPIVSTDLAGLRGILEHGRNALLVPPSNVGAMADGLEQVLTNAELASALRVQGSADFEARFDMDVASKRMTSFYEHVAACRR